jgi:uncharacterized YigZ family protein
MAVNDLKYFTPKKKARTDFTEQGSKFISDLMPAGSVEEALELIEKVRGEFPDATHHTYAFRIGAGSSVIERSSDDREPAGTAGAPILRFLQVKNISDVCLVATRYFGGTKLGIGGLTRAYRHCARLSLEAADMIVREPLERYLLQFKYDELGALTRLTESLEGCIIKIDYSDLVQMTVEIPARSADSLKTGFNTVCRGSGLLTLY